MNNIFDIGDTVSKKSGKPFKGGNKIDIIESFQVNENTPKKVLGAYLKHSKTIVSLSSLTLLNKIEYIYLISNDGYRDSLDVTVFFKHNDINSIQKYVEDYYNEYYNLKIKNLLVDYQNELINFDGIDDDTPTIVDKCKMHLYKIKLFNV